MVVFGEYKSETYAINGFKIPAQFSAFSDGHEWDRHKKRAYKPW